MSLRRKKPLKRSPMKRGKPLPRKSDKTAQRDLWYYQLRSIWLPGRECEATAKNIAACRGRATDVHHMRGRSAQWMLNVDTWCSLCRPCHDAVTGDPKTAFREGLSESRLTKELPMPKRNRERCECGQRLFWAKTITGKSMPLIADPNTGRPSESLDGNVQFSHEEIDVLGEVVTRVSVLGENDRPDPDKELWMSHFVDCPRASLYRKK